MNRRNRKIVDRPCPKCGAVSGERCRPYFRQLAARYAAGLRGTSTRFHLARLKGIR